jgi:predicted NAD-dependent protein-ADP-ribosyltransferase YbiA (DUF1768 family)
MAIIIGSEGYEWMNLSEGFPTKFEGVVYPSALHIYCAQFVDEKDRWRFENCTTGNARRFKDEYRVREIDDWEKILMMWEANLMKFRQHRGIRDRLIETGNEELVGMDNWFGDDGFWGVREDGSGKNWAGHVLKIIRDDLQRGRI